MDGGNEQRVAIKFCLKAGLSATETLVLVQMTYGNEALNRSNIFRWYTWFREGRELVEDDKRDGRLKSTRTEVNIAAVADLFKNDHGIASRMIAESLIVPKTVVLRNLKENLGEKVVCTFCSTLLDTWAKRKSSHILPRHYRVGRCRQNFFNKIIMGDRPGVLRMTPKQSDRVLSGLVRHLLDPRNWNSKGPASQPCWYIFFRLSKRRAQIIRTREKNSKCRIL